MRTLRELIDPKNPGWPIIKEWIGLAKNKTEILPADRQKAEESLISTQVSTRSLMGAVIYETGGILIDNGWIRILGSGCKQMKRSLPEWNKGKTYSEYGDPAPYLLVADDAIGGFFAINGGYFGKDTGSMYYFLPDSLEWVPMGIEYSQFLLFCFETDMDEFYQNLRWNQWADDIKSLNPDYAYNFFPFLWTKEGKDINMVEKNIIPIEEVYNFNMEMSKTSN